MTRFQGDLRDMDEIIQGISNVQTEHRVRTEKSKGFLPQKHCVAKYLLDECACFKYSEKEVSKQLVGTGLFDFCFLRFQLLVITKKCHSYAVVKAMKGLIKSLTSVECNLNILDLLL